MSNPIFWAKELHPGQVETLFFPSQSLVLCGGTILEPTAFTDVRSAPSTEQSHLLITLRSERSNHVDFPLCSFIPGKVEFVQLNVTIPLNDRVKLESRGRHTIFLYGNIISHIVPEQQTAGIKRVIDMEDVVKNKRQKTVNSGAEGSARPAMGVSREPFIRRASPEKDNIAKAMGGKSAAGRSDVMHLSDPTASKQLHKISAFDSEPTDVPLIAADKGKRREDARPSRIHDNANASSAPSSLMVTESDTEVMEAIGGGPKQTLSLWIGNQAVEVFEYSTGYGDPCGVGCLVTIQYMARNRDTSEYFWGNGNGSPKPKSFTFVVGDKNVPGVLNGSVNGARLQAERTLVIPSGTLRGTIDWPFSIDVDVLFEFLVTDITKKVEAEEEDQKEKGEPSPWPHIIR